MKICTIKNRNFQTIFILLVIATLLASIKSIFIDYDVDAGYAIAMAYRMVNGDTMFIEMWEPHQTSAFLCAFFIKIYLMIIGTTTGIVLYLQLVGVLIRCLFTIFFYYCAKKYIRKDILSCMCLFFFSVTPKWLPLPEFSNMLIWFSLGILCSLIKYLNEQQQIKWLILSGIFLCLVIIAYPSTVILYVGILFLLIKYSNSKIKSIFILTGICFLGGTTYILYFLKSIGYNNLLENIQNILASDNTHQTKLIDKFISYAKESAELVTFFLIVATVSTVILLIIRTITPIRKGTTLLRNWWFVFATLLFILDFIHILSINMDYDYRPPLYIPFIILALLLIDCCTEKEKLIIKIGMLISFLDFIAVLSLTNLDVMTTTNYLIIATMVSIIPIARKMESLSTTSNSFAIYGILFIFLGLTIFRSGYLAKTMNVQKISVFNVRGIVKEGPAIGIVSEYMGPYIFNVTMQEWKKYLSDHDKVLIVSPSSCDAIQYLFEDVEISAASTMSTPTYNENILDYWSQNPEKYPNVIIVDCWYGKLNISEDSWIIQWIDTTYPNCQYIDGMFWRYYFLTGD